VPLIRSDVSWDRFASIIRVEIISKLGKSAVTSNCRSYKGHRVSYPRKTAFFAVHNDYSYSTLLNETCHATNVRYWRFCSWDDATDHRALRAEIPCR
jgi:hypothetical protein